MSHERVIPAFCADPLLGSEPRVREFAIRPVIGFCGFIGRWLLIHGYSIYGAREKAKGLRLRRAALRIVNRSSEVRGNFILRNQFWAGALDMRMYRLHRCLSVVGMRLRGRAGKGDAATFDEKRRAAVYREFLDNIFSTDYTLAPRGAGNFSFRFYQTMAAGRIPVTIDTDLPLPFAAEVDWSRHAILVPESRLSELAKAIDAFHRDGGAAAFASRQAENRELWLKKLQPSAVVAAVIRETEVRGARENLKMALADEGWAA